MAGENLRMANKPKRNEVYFIWPMVVIVAILSFVATINYAKANPVLLGAVNISIIAITNLVNYILSQKYSERRFEKKLKDLNKFADEQKLLEFSKQSGETILDNIRSLQRFQGISKYDTIQEVRARLDECKEGGMYSIMKTYFNLFIISDRVGKLVYESLRKTMEVLKKGTIENKSTAAALKMLCDMINSTIKDEKELKALT